MLMARSAWLKPSAEPIAILEMGLFSSAAKSSTLLEASKPGTEQSKTGTLATILKNIIVTKRRHSHVNYANCNDFLYCL